MRRTRCPYCDSLNTAEFIAGNREEGITASGYICDDCDSSWDGPADAKAIKAERLRVIAESNPSDNGTPASGGPSSSRCSEAGNQNQGDK